MSDDWQNRGGIVTAGVQLPPMDMNVEHVFELIEVKLKPQVNTPYGIKDKIQFIWKEVGKEKDFHRIWTEFNESYSEKSSLVQFIKQASPKPVVPGVPIKLGEMMCIGMQIKGLVQARFDNKTKLPNGFYDFIPPSVKPAGSLTISKPALDNAQSTTDAVMLAYTHARGSKNFDEAYLKLAETKDITTQQVAAFVMADKNGQIKYPIP